MQINVLPYDVVDALAEQDPGEVMIFLATIAAREDAEAIIEAAARRHNGSESHRTTAPWLRRLADALEQVERRDRVIDAAGRVA